MSGNGSENFQRLIRVGIALSRERDRQGLLEMIVSEARAFTGADGGSLYLIDKEELLFAVYQNETLEEQFLADPKPPPFLNKRLPLNRDSVAGTVALSGMPLNIDDVYNMPPELTCTVSHDYDQQTGYRTRSMLTVPLKDPAGEVVGVLQLINARDEGGEPRPFPESQIELVEALGSQAAIAVINVQLNEELSRSHLASITRLAAAAEYRDKETHNHIQRISIYSGLLAKELELPADEIELIRYASPMHDIGKLGIPDAVLLKPGRLTPDERTVMEKHTTIGGEILKDPDSPILDLARTIALYHHERYDGEGYPDKRGGDDIPLPARIVGLVDVFDALSCRRVYKPAFPLEVVREIIKQDRGKHFDPEVFDAFEKITPQVEKIHAQIGET